MVTTSAMTAAEFRALAEFRYRIRIYLNGSEEAARNADLEPQQYLLMLALRGLPAGREPSIREVAERMRLLSKAHEIATQIDGTAPIVADRDRIEQVLENLVGNAIKYSPEAGHIEMSLHVNGANAVVSVRDEGIGIAPGEVEKIFGLFYRSPDPRADHVGGLGLGLYISREIVSRHHGRLWAERNAEAGTTFHVTLPIAHVRSREEARTA